MSAFRVGVIGYGHSTDSLLHALSAVNVRVRVCEPDSARRQVAAINTGAIVATLPADVAEDADVVVVEVTDRHEWDEALFGLGGVGETLREGGLVVDLSSGSDGARAATHFGQYGIRYLDLKIGQSELETAPCAA